MNKQTVLMREDVSQAEFTKYFTRVFVFMFIGLLITAATSFLSFTTGITMRLLSSEAGFWGIIIAEVLIVLIISFTFKKLNIAIAGFLFTLYSVATGITVSIIYMYYTYTSILSAFIITAAIFLLMAFYGAVTKRNLTGFGSIAIFGLIGVILAGVVNFFLRNPMLDFAITSIGVLIFIVLIAYDTQKIKNYYQIATYDSDADSVQMNKLALMGAFQLYLDFINLFLRLVRLLGKKK